MSFKLYRDVYGYAQSIDSEMGLVYIHLEPGTVRNEANAQALVDVLNAAEAVVKSDAYRIDMGALRRALAAFKKEGGA